MEDILKDKQNRLHSNKANCEMIEQRNKSYQETLHVKVRYHIVYQIFFKSDR